jgi:hypothetical protein
LNSSNLVLGSILEFTGKKEETAEQSFTFVSSPVTQAKPFGFPSCSYRKWKNEALQGHTYHWQFS